MTRGGREEGPSKAAATRADPAKTGGWEDAERVLCVRLDALGDVLMTTPAIRALKESRPGRRTILLTSPAGAGAARLVPEVDEVVVYEAPWMKATPPGATPADEHAAIERLRELRLDGAVIFTVYSQNPLPAAHMCLLARIPLRLAYCRENPYQLLTHWAPETEPVPTVRHEVARQLDLVRTIGCVTGDTRLSLHVPRKARATVGRLLSGLGIAGKGFVVVHPGASAPSRCYPAEGFAEVADGIARGIGMPVVFTGSPGERALVEDIQGMMQAASVSLAGRLGLAELAALLGHASLLVSNNTGPAHVACAVGAPVVSLYALTNPQHTPWGVPSRVLFHDVECRYCYKSVCPMGHHDCLRLLRPADVLSAVAGLLRELDGMGTARENEGAEDPGGTLPGFGA